MKRCLFLVSILLIAACAKHTKKVEPVEAKAAWLKTSQLYNHKSVHGDYLIHPFFDLVPYASTQDNSINFVLTMPENSSNKYAVDLRSGMLYRKHKVCSQKDVWGSYGGSLDRPPFSEGFVPRLLDQLGTPQKILVFGKGRYLHEFQHMPTRSQRVRVVGGVLQQYCENYPCKGKNKWLSRLVLIGVNQNDPTYKKVTHINQLKKNHDWEYIKAYMQNMDGRHINTSEEAPAYRVIGNIGPKEALVNALGRGHLFKYDELKSIRMNCQKLYDFIWKTSEEVRNEKFTAKNMSAEVEKTVYAKKDIFSGNVISDETKAVPQKRIDEELKKMREFPSYFKAFHKNYRKRFLTCQKFVRDTSINANPRRMWFFSYLTSFLRAEELGHIYSCSRQAWVMNPIQVSGKRMYSTDQHLRNCTNRELDRAFDMSITLFAGLSRAFQPHYRFIQYDEGEGASHQKLYSWVYNSGEAYACDKERYSKVSIFPRDINWESFGDTRKRKRTDLIE